MCAFTHMYTRVTVCVWTPTDLYMDGTLPQKKKPYKTIIEGILI